MKIIFIRHGEPDKAAVDQRGFIGQGRHFAPLTALGVQQAEEAAAHPLLEGCQLIVASLNIQVEIDLHEFIPDKTFQVKGEEESKALHKDFMRCQGEYPPGETRKWETITEIIRRTKPVLDKYFDMGYEKIAVVAHGGVIRRYTGVGLIAHCEVCEVDYTKDFVPHGWV